MKQLFSFLVAFNLFLFLAVPALAQTVSANGTVVCTQTEIISSQSSGTVLQVFGAVGDAIRSGDELIALDTQKVYALQAGTVHLFGEAGDDAAEVSEKYGAVAYVESSLCYTISTSTKNAYQTADNLIIHPGESVYLRASENSQHTGTGRVTAVTDTGYTVEVLSGSLQTGESVNIYRSADYNAVSRIGRDTLSLNAPDAYTATGLIVRYHVSEGAQVKKGDLLFETLDGTFTGEKTNLTLVTAPADGIIASLSLSKGSQLSAGGSVAEIYLNSGMRVEALVSESDLQFFQAGAPVQIELNYFTDGTTRLSGSVEKISRIAAENTSSDSEEALFSVLIIPENIEGLSYGLHAVITTTDDATSKETVTQKSEP